MPVTNNTFTPSINIERDQHKDFDYVVTSNSRQIYDQLIKNRDSGAHSYTMIGSYGTGKSSFLLALKKNLLGDTNYFAPLNGEFADINDFEFDFIVGKYDSLINKLAEHFGLSDNTSEKDVLGYIDKKHEQLKKEGKFWFIVVDEFGKHLEFAAKENPEKELYFVQLLSEYANDKDKNLYFITTLHQAFDSYAHRLDASQRKEWDKVRGRLRELTFNEPVEQLLYIAGEYLSGKKKDYDEDNLKKLISCIESSRAFPLRSDLELRLAKRLYPIDLLSAGILSQALQKYGQNERSLFTFLQSDEHLSINDYDFTNNKISVELKFWNIIRIII